MDNSDREFLVIFSVFSVALSCFLGYIIHGFVTLS